MSAIAAACPDDDGPGVAEVARMMADYLDGLVRYLVPEGLVS